MLSALYVWCQVNKDAIVQFWFGMQFKVSNNLYVLGHVCLALSQNRDNDE